MWAGEEGVAGSFSPDDDVIHQVSGSPLCEERQLDPYDVEGLTARVEREGTDRIGAACYATVRRRRPHRGRGCCV